ncbi:MAG: EamA family transporter [Alphaproteobacteria bacterium]|nr:MAG: EamA family transporter [Alphaproteobacteria bacterium]
MPIEPGVLVLVLLAAVLHATWNALVKAGGDRLIMITLVMAAPVPVCIAGLLLLPPLALAAWPFVLASAAIHYLYYALLVHSYRLGDLSQVYPIARGSAPALVAAAAWIFAGEPLRASEMAGVVIVSAGIMSLSWRRRAGLREGEAWAIGLALLNGLTIAAYLLVDGMGVRRSGHPLSYIAWLFVLEAAPLIILTLWRRRGDLVAAFRPHWRTGLGGGLIAGISYGIAIWAMGQGPMAHVVALRETSVIFGAAIGTLILKEPFGRRRIIAATVVATGAVLLNLGL